MNKMEESSYCKDDIYELIHKLIEGETNENDFSDEYYIAYIYYSDYWNTSGNLNETELSLFNQLAETANSLVSFAEMKLSYNEVMILKERLKSKAIQISKKMFIPNLLEQYFCDRISTINFCNKFYEWYDMGIYRDEMDQNKRIWFDELSIIAGRYSEFSEDHKIAPKFYTTEAEIKAKVKDILQLLQTNLPQCC